MSNKTHMPKVEFQDNEKLKSAFVYTKFAEEKNSQRALLASKVLKRKRIVLLGSLALVCGIYTYTITRINQETFLDDFEEPKRIETP